jgi:molybdopterin-guanine dinucleotide biosynthesis protein A
MDGADKASIELDGLTLLERALAATMTAVEVVVVGEAVPTSRPVTFTREDPRGGGPAAGLLAGVDAFYRPCDLLQVLAVDMPRATPGTFARLAEALTPSYDGAWLVDAGGRRQPLCAVYRWNALQRVRPARHEDEHGLAVHRLLGGLSLTEVPAAGDEAVDVDTWNDLLALPERSRGGPS